MEKAKYWDEIYQKKDELNQSWFQEKPEKSIEMIDELQLSKNAKIIDVGGGESRLVDFLLEKGFCDISLLDISKEALEKTKARLGSQAVGVKYIISDITIFKATEKYDLWHDRAAFHFLTNLEDIEKYIKNAHDSLNVGGSLIISTFSKSGPDKCSGLTISKYSQGDLKTLFGNYFQNTECFETSHTTPWGTNQDFTYCGFKKIN